MSSSSSSCHWLALLVLMVTVGTWMEDIWTMVGKVGGGGSVHGIRSLSAAANNNNNNNNNHGFVPSLQHLRFAAFGSSRTYGIALENRQKEAYIGLLSGGQGHNYGIRATGPEYPGKCLETLISNKDDHDNDDQNNVCFHVVVVDFYAYRRTVRPTPDAPLSDIALLVSRLRQRFPNAVIVLLKDWIPALYRHLPTNRNLYDFRQDLGLFHHELDDPRLLEHLRDDEWEYTGDDHADDEDAVAHKFGAVVVRLDRPVSSIRQALVRHGPCFRHDLSHFTHRGHAWIAQTIQNALLQHFNNNHNKQALLLDSPPTCRVQEWALHDDCRLVATDTGESALVYSKPNMNITRYALDNFAMSVRKSPGWIQIPSFAPPHHGNNNNKKKNLRVSVIVKVRGNRAAHPNATLQIQTRTGQPVTTPPRFVDATHHNTFVPYAVNWLVEVGSIPTNHQDPLVVHIDVPGYEQSVWPFRISGLALTEQEEKEEDAAVAVKK